MKQEDIKYVYEIQSTLDLDEIIDSLKEELKIKEGLLIYFSLSRDDLIKEKLPIDELKIKALEINNNDEYPSLVFQDVEVNVDESKIEILSKIKLKLYNIDVDNIIEK